MITAKITKFRYNGKFETHTQHFEDIEALADEVSCLFTVKEVTIVGMADGKKITEADVLPLLRAVQTNTGLKKLDFNGFADLNHTTQWTFDTMILGICDDEQLKKMDPKYAPIVVPTHDQHNHLETVSNASSDRDAVNIQSNTKRLCVNDSTFGQKPSYHNSVITNAKLDHLFRKYNN